MALDEHRRTNQRAWDSRAEIHAASTTYDLDGFVADPQRLSGVVSFDRGAIGAFAEHHELEWQAWPLWQRDPVTGRYALPEPLRNRVPGMYTLVATAPGAW